MLAEKNRARIADAFESFFGHRKHANFVHRTKAVFDRTHQSVGGMGVAFKVQNRIDHVLQHARASQSTFFGDMPDQHNSRARGFGHAGEMRRTFTHLGDGAWRAGELV